MNTLSTFSSHHLPSIESALISHLPTIPNDARKKLSDAMHYSVTAKAKRIRPLLVLASHSLFQKSYEPIMPVACAAEYIHTYSLIHDDLPSLDNDDLRRGQPTCHKKFGEALAILAGDTLNTYAFELLAQELPRAFSPSASLKAIHYFASSLGINGMAGGQILDIYATSLDQSIDTVEKIHLLKTASLIQACLVIPAILSEIPKTQIEILEKAGHHLGLLFQITDDILDVVGSNETLGKTIGKDQEQNKTTYVSILGLEGAKHYAKKESEHALNTLASLSYPTMLLADMIEQITMRTS